MFIVEKIRNLQNSCASLQKANFPTTVRCKLHDSEKELLPIENNQNREQMRLIKASKLGPSTMNGWAPEYGKI